MARTTETAEHVRLRSCGQGTEARTTNHHPWKKWGPYLSERQWGTVREDYSDDGDAWNHFSHDQARSRAYRWGEDGLGGISDDRQVLCLALALWNGRDPILKERLFGLTNSEGNHGEDVKEYYFYLDSTPTHSYMKYLYKYPQSPFPYDDLVRGNARRTRLDPEYELLDTGCFADDRYFDVFVEYAKAGPDDMLVRITAHNRGPDAAPLHVLPTLWFRNTWSWPDGGTRPELRGEKEDGHAVITARHTDPLFLESLPHCTLRCEGAPELLFTENDTNTQRLYGTPNERPWVKDGINDHVVAGAPDTVNPAQEGTKAAAWYRLHVPAGGSATIRLRLTAEGAPLPADPFGAGHDAVFAARQREADEFYRAITPPSADEDRALVLRQALAGMLWSKQYYYFDADKLLEEHHAHPLLGQQRQTRNREWFHMVNDHIISMPDKWEYPWYAAWDLAFHAVALSTADPEFAKEQLDLMLREIYMHPSGQLPAYEWNFSDVNPPVHAWATLFLYLSEKALHGRQDVEFLKRAFTRLALNFTWWVNRKDRDGNNIFEGGFLGLDNIGVFDRSAPLPTGGHLEQADGTAWMAFFCQNMMEIAAELTVHDPVYEDFCAKFVEHFLWIAMAINRPGEGGLWDEEDGFYYDLLRLPDGTAQRLKVRSLVGLLPLCAVTVVEEEQRARMPRATAALLARLARMPELLGYIHATGPGHLGCANRGIIALVSEERLRRILTRVLDENEFLGPYGIRALSRHHLDHPYVFHAGGQEYRVGYLPAESDSGMFGGNSNWRGPVWMPVNVLIVRALLSYYMYYGDNFRIECPTGSGVLMNLYEVAQELAARLTRIFLRGPDGARPVLGGEEKFRADPHWRDCVLFYEYFHGDNGAGIGASHQTGWTGLVAKLIELFGLFDPQALLQGGKQKGFKTGQ